MSKNLTEKEIYAQITGNIILSKSNDHGVDVVVATWEGGDTICLSKSFVEYAETEDAEYVTKHGSFIKICDFTVKIFDYYDEYELYIAKRVN